jgi:hypothetical protein
MIGPIAASPIGALAPERGLDAPMMILSLAGGAGAGAGVGDGAGAGASSLVQPATAVKIKIKQIDSGITYFLSFFHI